MEIHNSFKQITSALQMIPQTYCPNESISLFVVIVYIELISENLTIPFPSSKNSVHFRVPRYRHSLSFR